MNVYNTTDANIFAIDVDNKIYNLVLDFDSDKKLNSYLKGGIIKFKNPITNLYNPSWFIESPNNLLIEDDKKYNIKNVEKILYDSNVWTHKEGTTFQYKKTELVIDISNFNIREEHPQYVITPKIEKMIKEILINVEKI